MVKIGRQNCKISGTSTLYNELLRIARNLLETRENIKIESRSFYHIICGWFSWGWSKQIFLLKKKKSKMADFQNGRFSKSLILKILLWKFHGLVLGLVGLIDAKGIDVAQPIWLWDCPTFWKTAILKNGHFENRPFWIFFLLHTHENQSKFVW